MEYRDLSPTNKAAEELAKKLPDEWNMSGEVWRIFHFKTEDSNMVLRTAQLACKKKQISGSAVLTSAEEFYRWVEPTGKKTAGFDFSNLNNQDEIMDGQIIFVNMTTDSGASGSKTKVYHRLLFEFIQYCEMIQNEQTVSQNQYGKSFREMQQEQMPVYRQIFFVSYGRACTLPELFKNNITTISYSALTEADFGILLQEFDMRNQLRRKEICEKRQLPVKEPEVLDTKKFSKTLEWYTNHMAGMQEATVRRMLCDMRNMFQAGDADYTRTDIIEKYVRAYKNKILQHGRLEMVEAKKDAVHGMKQIEDWLNKHSSLMRLSKDAPTGILLVGIPGTGKSATAHMAANRFNLPLARLDISKVLGGHVGDSEKGMKEVLEDLKFAAPCILWIDEIEKAMSGADGKSGDGGVMQRLSGMLLTFIQENEQTVFTVATANDISKLPPEFFRNGRFDQAFCVMMPDYRGCCTIMQKKLEKYCKKLGWNKSFTSEEGKLVFDSCTGTKEHPRFLTGADIEAHVKELFWYYKMKGDAHCPDVKTLAFEMKKIANKMRVQASPDSPNTMQDIAVRYLDMMQRGMQMAGSADTPFIKENLNLDVVRYYEFDEKNPSPLPSCITKRFQEHEERRNSDKPEDWYDVIFFDELVKAMNEAIIFDKELTLDATRMEYMKLKRHEINSKKKH